MAKTTIPGGYIETGSIDTASLADTSITADKLHTTLDLTGKAVTVATATAGDNDTTVASTAFVSTAIATKLPLAGGTMSGTIADFTSTGIDDNATSTAITIDSSENVGIGTTTPARALHVVGTGRPAEFGSDNITNYVKLYNSATGNGTYNGLDLLVNSTSNSQINAYGMPLTFGTSASNGTNVTERMRIDSVGNVGIGTTSPSESLTVDGNIESLNTIIINDGTYKWQNLISSGDLVTRYNVSNAWYERMRIDSSGNIGIGTSSPAAGLQISKGLENAGGPAAGASTASACFGNDNSDDNYGLVLGADGNGRGYISAQRTDGTATTYDLMLQPNGGNVGIGTENPSAKLEVRPTNNVNLLVGNTGSELELTSGTNGGTYGAIANHQAHTHNFLTDAGSGTFAERMTVNSTGPVLPAGNFGYHTTQEHYTAGSSGATSYSTASNITYSSSTAYWPDQGEKQICVINARAYTKYIHIKTNLTADNIMFYFRTKGYFYSYGCEEQLIGGYTYGSGSTVISKDNQTVAGNSHSGDTYRASDGSLVLKMDINQTGYTEGKMLVFFHSHAPSITSGITVTAVKQKDDGTNAF